MYREDTSRRVDLERPDIGRLAQADVTRGCTKAGTRHCPGDTLTRGQLAAMLVNADRA